MKKTNLLLIVLAACLLLTAQAFARSPQPGKGKGCPPCREACLEKLSLTDAQKAKIETLQDGHHQATRPLQEKIFDKSVELRRLWLQTNPDKNKISAAQKELRTMRDELEDQTTVHRLEVLQVLTLAQRQKLANSGWNKKAGFGPRGGMRGYKEFGRKQGAGPGLGMGMCR